MPNRTNPECPSSTHGSVSSIRRKPSCICPGPHHEAFKSANDQENARRVRVGRERGRHTIDSVNAPDFWAPAVPEAEDLGEETKTVLNSDDAACRKHPDPDLWFADGTKGSARADTELAKAICRSCPVLHACRRAVLERREEYGVWGAMAPEERRQARAARLRESVAA